MIYGDLMGRWAQASPDKEALFDTIEHIPDDKAVLEEVRRILKPGGHVIVDVPQTFHYYTLGKKLLIALDRWFAGWETQFTPAQLALRPDWGHCTPAYAVEVARQCEAKRLVLFHHDPIHDDHMVDRLLDGKTTGIGMWEASMNNTHRAIDLIPKDVVIADWHYERPDPTAVLFAMKGFDVVTCSWNRAEVVGAQIRNMRRLRLESTLEMRDRFRGVMHTVWHDTADFLDEFYGRAEPEMERGDPIGCSKRLPW